LGVGLFKGDSQKLIRLTPAAMVIKNVQISAQKWL